MAIVYDKDGTKWPLAKLISARRNREDYGAYFEGAEERVRIEDVEMHGALQRWVQAALPAQPGTYLVSYSTFDGDIAEMLEEDDFTWRRPVIGWAITMEGMSVPVTADDGLTLDYHAILYPDGTVEKPGGAGTFPDYPSYLLSVRKLLVDQLNRARAKANPPETPQNEAEQA